VDSGPQYAQLILYVLTVAPALLALMGGASLLLLLREGGPPVRRPQVDLGALGLKKTAGGHEGVFLGQTVRYSVPEHGLHRWSISVGTGSLSLCSRLEPEESLQTGDPYFDRHFVLGGEVADRSWLTPAVREALRRLLPCSVRLEGGVLWADDCALQPQVAERLAAVAQALAQVPTDRGERLQAWLERVPPERKGEAYVGLAAQEPALALALARDLARGPSPQLRERAELLVRGTRGELLPERAVEERLWVARVLAEGHDASAEALLVSLLPELEGEGLAQGAALLAMVGSVQAVPALRARQARLPMGRISSTRRIDEAVAAIQQRAGGAPGGLAVAGTPDAQGALAVAAAARGAMSQERR
jgi:hypothetical protein